MPISPKLPKTKYPWAWGNDNVRIRWVVDGKTDEGLLFLDTMNENGKMRIFRIRLEEVPWVECYGEGA